MSSSSREGAGMSSNGTRFSVTDDDSDASFEDSSSKNSSSSDSPALLPTTLGSRTGKRLAAKAQEIVDDALNFLNGGGELQETLHAHAHKCPARSQAASSRAMPSGGAPAGAFGWSNAQVQTGLAVRVHDPMSSVGSFAHGVHQFSAGLAQHVFGLTQASSAGANFVWPESWPASTAGQASGAPFPQAFGAPVTQHPHIRKRQSLTIEAVTQIFLAKRTHSRQRGLTSRLARHHGVTAKAVRDIWTLRTWKAVTEPMWNDAERQLVQNTT